MKARKSRRGVSTIIAVLLMIIITVAAAVIVWAFLSGYIGARTAPSTQQSVIQINAIGKGASGTADVQLVTVGSNATIVAVYKNGVNQPSFTWTPGSGGWNSIGDTGTLGGLGLITTGDVVKVVCADGGAASATAV